MTEIFDTAVIYVENKDIDRAKWDRCIEAASNGSIYVLSFYLDTMSRNWDALIAGNYKIVMPLIWNKKYGFYYLYQPYFLQHTGIFGHTNDNILNIFLSSIPKHFKYWDIDFKENIISPDKLRVAGMQFKKRRNFFLDLGAEYQKINKGYKRLAQRMIRKANEKDISVLRNCDPGEVINFYKTHYKKKQKNDDETYKRLMIATTIAFNGKRASTYLAKAHNGEVVAVYLVLNDKRNVYSLIGGSNEMGKEHGAFYLLTDAAIKDHAGSDRVFRFEGSDKKGIALFNSQFNAEPVDYYHLKLNGLPWPVRLLKK